MQLWMRSSRLWSRLRNPTRRTRMAKKKKTSRSLTPVHLSLPATSANLGPAFDAAALALDLYITVDARPAPDFSITATGRDPEICGAVKNHLILTTYGE